MRYEVQTLTFADGWVNTWTSDGNPEYFNTYEEAECALHEFLVDIQEAVAEGYITEEYDGEDYRIAEVNMGWEEQFDKFFIRKLGA